MGIVFTLLIIVSLYWNSGSAQRRTVSPQRHSTVRQDLSRMLEALTNNTGHTFDETEIPPQHKYSWKVLSKSPYAEVYSAYFEYRREPQVKILGLQNRQQATENPVDYYCLVRYGHRREECLSTPATQTPLNQADEKDNSLWAYAFICYSNYSEFPSHIGLSTNKDCSYALDLPVTIKYQVTARDNFRVCIQTALHQTSHARGNVKVETIVEGIERNRAMGAQHITVYVYRASSDVMKVLRDYETEGVLEIVDWKLTREAAQGSYYYAESVSIADCLYRNMYKAKLAVFTDLDEIIVPQQHKDWREMMGALHKPGVATYQFQHSAILTDLSTPHVHINWTCPGAKIIKQGLPLYLTRTLRTPPYPFAEWQAKKGLRQKMIVNPGRVVALGIHSKRSNVRKVEDFIKVPPEIGLLYHYREISLCPNCRDYAVRDHRLGNIAPQLKGKIRERYCRYQ